MPNGAVFNGTELKVSRVVEPFALPSDLAASPAIAAAFSQAFTVAGRFRIEANARDFGALIRLSVLVPAGAQPGDLYFAVRSREVDTGGLLADLDDVSGLTAAENPARRVCVSKCSIPRR